MPSAAKRSTVRTVITVVMDLLMVLVVVCVAHVIVSFFGRASSAGWGKGLLSITRLAVLPLHLGSIKTPYAGLLDVDATVTVLVLLAADWVLSLVRREA
jgi:hypothetical protein